MSPGSSDTIALQIAKWLGTATGIAGALIIALNLDLMVAGFVLFFVSSVLWSAVSWVQREASLLVLQLTFTVINLVGIYRWTMF